MTRLEVIVCYSGYFDDCLEKFATKDKPVYIMGDFNIDLLKSPYSHNFLSSLQSYHLHPTIDRVRTLFQQKIQGLFKNFQGHIAHFSKTHSVQKKSLESMSFLVLPQHEYFYPEGPSVFAEGRLLEGGHLTDANSKSFPFNEL